MDKRVKTIPHLSRFGIHHSEDIGELTKIRRSVLVGITNLKKVQWFNVIRSGKKRFTYEPHNEFNDVRGSLCACPLKSSLRDLWGWAATDNCVQDQVRAFRFWGTGATRKVLYVKRRGLPKFHSLRRTCRTTTQPLWINHPLCCL